MILDAEEQSDEEAEVPKCQSGEVGEAQAGSTVRTTTGARIMSHGNRASSLGHYM